MEESYTTWTNGKIVINDLNEKLFSNSEGSAVIMNKNKLIACMVTDADTVSYTSYDQKTLSELDGGEQETDAGKITLKEFLAFIDDRDFIDESVELSNQKLFRFVEEDAETMIEELENLSCERMRIQTDYSLPICES